MSDCCIGKGQYSDKGVSYMSLLCIEHNTRHLYMLCLDSYTYIYI